MSGYSRREMLAAGGGFFTAAVFAGCQEPLAEGRSDQGTSPATDGDDDGTSEQEPGPPEESGTPTVASDLEAPLGYWVPRPAVVSDRDYYVTSDVVFWNYETIRSYEDALHPSFYDRITTPEYAETVGVDPSSVTLERQVADGSLAVMEGSFQAGEVESHLLSKDGYSVADRLGPFTLIDPGEYGYHAAVAPGVVLVSRGTELTSASGSIHIGPADVLRSSIRARTRGTGLLEDRSSFRTLTDQVTQRASGSVWTFERVEETNLAVRRFAGTVGVADGIELGEQTSTYSVTLLYDDTSSVAVEPVRSWVEQHPGMSEFDEVDVETSGRRLRVDATMATERFDAYLPGDPDERA